MANSVYGLIGYPLTHSFSKKYFDEKFIVEKIKDCDFQLFSIESISDLSSVTSKPNIRGFAITIPYKKQIIPFLNEMDNTVKKLGACNCVCLVEGRLKGYNTDVIGFKKSLLQHLKPHHKHALVLGTGGAAAAVEFVFSELQIAYKNVSRNPHNNNDLSYSQLNKKIMEQHTLIVNTTPLGTYPAINDCPNLPYHFLNSEHLLFDLVYNPSITKFMQHGINKKSTTVNGYDMLVYQAEENWKIWNGSIQ